MKKLTFILINVFLIGSLVNSNAQNVTVQPAEKYVDKMPHKGMMVQIDLDKGVVEKAWKKKLKDFGGKSSGAKGGTIIEGATVSAVSNNPVKIVTDVSNNKNGCEVWWAIDKGTEWVTQQSSSYSSASAILKEFGISVYKEDITEQIEEAEKEYEKTVKNYERCIKDGEKMSETIESNKDTIEKLKAENTQLEQDIVTNKSEQEEFKKDIETMKQKVEETKRKLDMVK